MVLITLYHPALAFLFSQYIHVDPGPTDIVGVIPKTFYFSLSDFFVEEIG